MPGGGGSLKFLDRSQSCDKYHKMAMMKHQRGGNFKRNQKCRQKYAPGVATATQGDERGTSGQDAC